MLLPQVFSVPPFLLHKMKALTKAIHPILKDNPSLCSRLSKLFTRSFHFPIPNLFNWYILSWSHLFIQFLSASPVPIYTLCENTHPASACQICTFHFSSWELLSSKEHSHQGWFWFLYTIQASPPLPALRSGHSIRYCSDRVLGISIMYVAAQALSCCRHLPLPTPFYTVPQTTRALKSKTRSYSSTSIQCRRGRCLIKQFKPRVC